MQQEVMLAILAKEPAVTIVDTQRPEVLRRLRDGALVDETRLTGGTAGRLGSLVRLEG
jgi:hypothetical protein